MNRTRTAALALVCAMPLLAVPMLIPTAAFAAESVAATGTNGPVFWWGPLVSALSQAFVDALVPVITTAAIAYLAKNYPMMKAFVTDKWVNDQIQKAVDYAMNAEAGALRGGYVKVDFGPSVLGTAVARMAEKADLNLFGKAIMKWAGGPEEVAKKAFRMMHLDESASAENVLIPVLQKIADGTLLPAKVARLSTGATAVVSKAPAGHGVPVR